MNDKLQLFNCEGQDLAIKEIDGEVYFNAEQAAIGLGISTEVNGNIYVRWPRINSYLGFATCDKKLKKVISSPSHNSTS